MSESDTSPPASPVPEQVTALGQDMFKRIQGILTSRKPYCSGTLCVTKDQLVLFYGKDASTAGRIDFSNVTDEELEHLVKTCDQATFGVNQETVLDEQYRKSKKLDTTQFNPLFDVNAINITGLLRQEFISDNKQDVSIRVARYKLNIYEPGSFFKSHVDTPRGENMFGSLVIVFPTPHEGGTLLLRDAGKEWSVDAALDIKSNPEPCVAFAAFYGDVEHEVLPVTSGYRVTMTYNLYYERTPPVTYIRTNTNEVYEHLKATFEEMLANPHILPDGGYLGFGLQRQYGLSKDTDLRDLEQNLKGSDALLLSVCNELSMNATIRILYRSGETDEDDVLSDQIQDLGCDEVVEDWPKVHYIANYRGAFRVAPGDRTKYYDEEKPRPTIKWVIDEVNLGRVFQNIVTYGNQPSLEEIYGDVCLIVAVGPYRDRKDLDVLQADDN